MVVFPDDNELKLLNTIEERKELLEKAGIDHLIIHPFSKAFSIGLMLSFSLSSELANATTSPPT